MVFIKPHLHLCKLFLYLIQLNFIQVSYPVWVCHLFPWQDLGTHSPLWGVIFILFPKWHSGKESTCQCRTCKRHVFKSPEWGRSPGVGNSNPLQHSCLENSMDKIPCSLGSQRVRHDQVTEHTHVHIAQLKTVIKPWTKSLCPWRMRDQDPIWL